VRVLVVKTSSLGDVLHTLPALTEASRARPGLRFDWLLEPAFAAVPRWHPAVDQVVEAPLRALRRRPLRDGLAGLARLDRRLRARRYDAVVDAQGLLKSGLLARRARGLRFGPDPRSVRERPAAWCYDRWVRLTGPSHAADRLRILFAATLGHRLAPEAPDHGIAARVAAARRAAPVRDEVLLLHGTTWRSKHWPEAHWCALAERLAADGFAVRLPFGDGVERQRAERIAAAGRGDLLPPGDLDALLDATVRARGVIGVDAGPLHLAAAAGTPGVALYGPTDPARTGPYGPSITVLRSTLRCAPCGARRCASPLPPIGGASALEPPCLGRIEPARVHDHFLARLRGR
jgi:heptosyltransferase-1